MNFYHCTTRNLFIIAILVLLGFQNQASNLYWIGGSANWTNPSKWSLTSGGPAANMIPDANRSAIFDSNSGLVNGSTIVIPVGDHSVLDFKVQITTASFKFSFTGASGTDTHIDLHGDLLLNNSHGMMYGQGEYIWRFHGKHPSVQKIETGGKNLNKVYFNNENVNYQLEDDLNANEQIRFIAGSLKTNNHNLYSEYIYLRDFESSCCPLTKEIIAGTSTFYTNKFNSKFDYGSLTLIGDFTIRTEILIGGSHTLNDVYLLDYEVDLNDIYTDNLDCWGCIIDKLIVENIYDNKFKCGFTVEELFEIKTQGTVVYFNTINATSNDEVTINGTIKTPNVASCQDERVKWESISEQIIYFNKSSGTLSLKDSEVVHIATVGNANFILDNGLINGMSQGWSETNTPASLTYLWTGDGTDNLWNNPLNWSVGGSSNGCIPTINDDVILNNPVPAAIAHIEIPSGYTAACRNITRTSTFLPGNLYVDQVSPSIRLRVSGSVSLPSNFNFINGLYGGTVQFISSSSETISCSGVDLPSFIFKGYGKWDLLGDLDVRYLSLESGILNTNGKDIDVEYDFVLTNDFPTTLNLSNSTINITNNLASSFPYGNNMMKINTGTSTINVSEIGLEFPEDFHNVKLTNTTATTLKGYKHTFNKLELAGGEITTQKTIIIDTLLLSNNDVTLNIEDGDSLIINEAIISTTPASNPAKIKSTTNGSHRVIHNQSHNICVEGIVDFKDVEADIFGIMHAPLGIDSGNNLDINFSNSSVLTPLYWIGRKGEWDVRQNWSNVSGGCPVNKNPNTALRLIFDDNSFFSDKDTISLPVLTNCKTMDFVNTIHPAILDIETRLNPLQIYLTDATTHLVGSKMYIQSKVIMDGESKLFLDITEGVDPKFDTPILTISEDSEVILETTTKVIVRD